MHSTKAFLVKKITVYYLYLRLNFVCVQKKSRGFFKKPVLTKYRIFKNSVKKRALKFIWNMSAINQVPPTTSNNPRERTGPSPAPSFAGQPSNLNKSIKSFHQHPKNATQILDNGINYKNGRKVEPVLFNFTNYYSKLKLLSPQILTSK